MMDNHPSTEPVEEPEELRDGTLRNRWETIRSWLTDKSWRTFTAMSLLIFAVAFFLMAWNSVDATQAAQRDAQISQEDALRLRTELDAARDQIRIIGEENTCRTQLVADVDVAFLDYIMALGSLISNEGDALLALAEDDRQAFVDERQAMAESNEYARRVQNQLALLRQSRADTVQLCSK